jgi:hypothetical protein
MVTKQANHTDWTLQGEMSDSDPRTLCELLQKCGIEATLRASDEDGYVTTWTDSDGKLMEARQVEERWEKNQPSGPVHVSLATAIKPAGSGWEGFYTRVVLTGDFEYRIPVGGELGCEIQVLIDPDRDIWSPARPALTPDELNSIDASVPFAVFGDPTVVYPPQTEYPHLDQFGPGEESGQEHSDMTLRAQAPGLVMGVCTGCCLADCPGCV